MANYRILRQSEFNNLNEIEQTLFLAHRDANLDGIISDRVSLNNEILIFVEKAAFGFVEKLDIRIREIHLLYERVEELELGVTTEEDETGD